MSLYYKKLDNGVFFGQKSKITHRNGGASPGGDQLAEQTYGSCICIDLSDFKSNSKLQKQTIRENEFDAYHALISAVIKAHNGLVEAGSDLVCGLFTETTHGKEHAQHATEAAYELMDRLIALNIDRKMLRYIPFRLGIGVSTGVIEKNGERNNATSGPIAAAYHISMVNRATPIHTYFMTQETKALLDMDKVRGSLEDLGMVSTNALQCNTRTFAVIHNDS